MIVKDDKKGVAAVANNFRNRYIDSAELPKPDVAESQKKMAKTRVRIDEILGVKKQAAFGTNIKKLGTT